MREGSANGLHEGLPAGVTSLQGARWRRGLGTWGLAIGIAVVGGAGCGSLQASKDRFANGEVLCESRESCDAMWRAASSWVSRNSTLELQRPTDSFMETSCGPDSFPLPCYTLMRQPLAGGQGRIRVYVACGSDFVGCATPATLLKEQLTDYMCREAGSGD